MTGLKIIPTGDANFWRLFDDDRWIAVIQFNGELLEARQLEIGRQFSAAADMLAAHEAISSAITDAASANLKVRQRSLIDIARWARAAIAKATGVSND